MRAPLDLDVTWRDWPVERADALVCINMIHIAPWAAAQGLFAGARRILPVGGVVYLYGPYRIGGRAQHGVAELADGADRHGRQSVSPAPSAQRRPSDQHHLVAVHDLAPVLRLQLARLAAEQHRQFT